MERITEILENSFFTKKPVDNYLKGYFRQNKNLGARDRARISDAIWGIVRNYKTLSLRFLQDTKAMAEFILETPNFKSDILEYPDFLLKKLDKKELEFMQNREETHIDIRVNQLKSTFEKVMRDLKNFEPIKLRTRNGIRISKRVDFNTIKSFKAGAFEIQDEGSQMVSDMIPLKGGSVLDYCAGAGGKTLFIAEKMKNKGEIVSYDIYPTKLDELNKRAKRLGISIIETRYPYDNELFDTVIGDVPCSGTGTYARCPDAKWRIDAEKVTSLVEEARRILTKVKNNVKPEGILSFITCSLLEEENTDQVEWFLKENSDFELIESKEILPSVSQTDGFFIANLRKK